jgi:hypothetical protein
LDKDKRTWCNLAGESLHYSFVPTFGLDFAGKKPVLVSLFSKEKGYASRDPLKKERKNCYLALTG